MTQSAELPLPPPLVPPDPPGFRRAHRVPRIAALVLLFVGGGAAGWGATVGLTQGHPATAAALPNVPASNPQAPVPTAPATDSTSAIAAMVDPAVVDITATLATGGEVAGTGMVISSSGQVLTNNHVIAGTSTIHAQIDGSGTTYTATVVGTDVSDDIAVLQLQGASGLRTVNIGTSSTVTVGEPVVAIGNALGKGGTPAATAGAVTALNQTITAGDSTSSTETLSGAIQMDAFIQPGDSGGPLVDASGHVIGIDAAAQSAGPSADSGSTTGFAIPIDKAMSIVQQIDSGQPSANVQVGTRGILGVTIDGNTAASGVAVAAVEPGSPAANAGIGSGAVIESIDGTATPSLNAMQAALLGKHAGDTVTVTWSDANGAEHSATVQLEAGPPA